MSVEHKAKKADNKYPRSDSKPHAWCGAVLFKKLTFLAWKVGLERLFPSHTHRSSSFPPVASCSSVQGFPLMTHTSFPTDTSICTDGRHSYIHQHRLVAKMHANLVFVLRPQRQGATVGTCHQSATPGGRKKCILHFWSGASMECYPHLSPPKLLQSHQLSTVSSDVTLCNIPAQMGTEAGHLPALVTQEKLYRLH